MTSLATITSKNQLTIPKEVVEALNLKKLRRVLVSVQEGEITLKPLDSKVDLLAGSLSHLSSGPVDLKEEEKKTRETVAAEIAEEGT